MTCDDCMNFKRKCPRIGSLEHSHVSSFVCCPWFSSVATVRGVVSTETVLQSPEHSLFGPLRKKCADPWFKQKQDQKVALKVEAPWEDSGGVVGWKSGVPV